MQKRLAIVTTHPIQYNAPLFRLITERGAIHLKVFYTWGVQSIENKFDPGFNKIIEWDIPLLDGYEYEFLQNIAIEKGSHHYKGIDNPDLISRIEGWNADAVLVIGWNFKSHLKVLKYFKNKMPVFFRGDSTLLDQKGSFKGMIRKLVLSYVYKHIDKAFYVGTNNKSYYKYCGLADGQLIYAAHAIDNNRFMNDADEESAIWLRRGLNIRDSEMVFLFAGKFEPKKAPFLLIDAFIEARIPNAHLVMIGNGPLEQQVKASAAENNQIHFMDFQNQSAMPAVYRMADVFVLPSSGPGETWGLAINEAMASGKPVIASDRCGGAIDLIENGSNGYIFKSSDKKALIETMKKILTHDLKLMGKASRNRVQKFNFVHIAAAVETATMM